MTAQTTYYKIGETLLRYMQKYFHLVVHVGYFLRENVLKLLRKHKMCYFYFATDQHCIWQFRKLRPTRYVVI